MKLIKTASVENANSILTQSDGDLWPCAWSDDDAIYTANGDGKGFDLESNWCDIVVNKVTGSVESLHGERLSGDDGVGMVYVDAESYNRKPTGMVSANGQLYMAVQSLNKHESCGFDDVPCASICHSPDKGISWRYDTNKPMFDNYKFTTIFFLDYGKDNSLSPDGYIYAYGMDDNWRASFSKRVPDPTKLYLARVLPDEIMNRKSWEFYCGMSGGKPTFLQYIDKRQPVLEDTRRIAVTPPADKGGQPCEMTVVSQGCVVYNKPLDRYLYSSWTENSYEFYESATPWGPFKLFLSHDFGFYPWSEQHHGGYATVIPSKFISEDGKTMYVVSCTFVGGVKQYGFYLRKLTVDLV